MAANKRSRQLLPDLEDLTQRSVNNKKDIATVKAAYQQFASIDLGLCSSHSMKTLDENVKLTWLIARYGAKIVLPLLIATQRMPESLTEHEKVKFLTDAIKPVEASETHIEAVCMMLNQECLNLTREVELALNKSSALCSSLFAPPARECISCQRRLVSYHTTSVMYYRCSGVQVATKISLRCQECGILYNYAQYGNKTSTGFRFYENERDAIEVTDGVFFERKLLNLQCGLANHSWVSFQGFAESYNDAFHLLPDNELSPKIVAAAFWKGEVEAELRRIDKLDYCFRLDSDIDACMDMIESVRREALYSHPSAVCTLQCKDRGCGRLWVTDGLWKLTFAHCMYEVKYTVSGIPTLNLPNVCANQPVHGKAFCAEHCQLLTAKAPTVPTNLREFLQFCNIGSDDSVALTASNVDMIDLVMNQLPNDVTAGQNAATSQGILKMLSNHPTLSFDVEMNDVLCRKELGDRKTKLRKWSRGHQFIVRGGGHIDTWQPLYRSESPSQVFYILIQWLLLLHEKNELGEDVILAYDNMCNLERMRASRQPLPLEPPLDQLWLKVIKIIDKFHFPNHVSEECKKMFSPDKIKEKYPHFNTQVGEQTFTWLHRFRHILCAMPKNHHLFYLHRMVIRRNFYTEKCYQHGKKPLLPKLTHDEQSQ